ncbi:MAG: peroxiredoxin family protein [Archangium sp.]
MLTLVLMSALAAQPAVGDVAPDFTVTSVDGAELELSALVEKGPVILAFFPKAFTSGCTRELTAYVARYDDVKKAGAEIIAVSTDDAATSRKFRDSLKAPYPFVADDKATLTKLYDVKTFLITLSRRVTFVIGPGRKVLAVQEGGDAVDPNGAVAACTLRANTALELVTDGGTR